MLLRMHLSTTWRSTSLVSGLEVRGWPSTENGQLMFDELELLELGCHVTKTSPDCSKQLCNMNVNFEDQRKANLGFNDFTLQ